MGRHNILELGANGAATPLATVRARNALALRTAAVLDVRPAAAARPLALADVWCDVAQRVSLRDGHDDDRDVLPFFVLANALADADDAARDGVCTACAAAEVLRRFTGSDRLDAAATFTDVARQEAGRTIGARVFDKARRYWQGRL